MILAIKTEKIGNLVLNLATRCQQPYILAEGESCHWTNSILTDFEVPDEIIQVGNTANEFKWRTYTSSLSFDEKKSWLFSIFFPHLIWAWQVIALLFLQMTWYKKTIWWSWKGDAGAAAVGYAGKNSTKEDGCLLGFIWKEL